MKAMEIDDSLQVLCSEIQRIQLTAQFPTNIPIQKLEAVQCAALDLSAAVMEYLAVVIQRLQKRLLGQNNVTSPYCSKYCHEYFKGLG